MEMLRCGVGSWSSRGTGTFGVLGTALRRDIRRLRAIASRQRPALPVNLEQSVDEEFSLSPSSGSTMWALRKRMATLSATTPTRIANICSEIARSLRNH
jgi:hypothetical protein